MQLNLSLFTFNSINVLHTLQRREGGAYLPTSLVHYNLNLIWTLQVTLLIIIIQLKNYVLLSMKLHSFEFFSNKKITYNPGQNIWQKVKRYNKTGQGFKNIISNFACFFDSYCQRLVSGRLGTRLRLHPHLTFS